MKFMRIISGFISGLLLCVFILQPIYGAPAWPEPENGINALAGIVIDADTGAILFEKDADASNPPASTTKILTAMLVLEHCDDLDDIVTFSKTAIERVEPDSGQTVRVSEGDQLTVRDCLYALLLRSSNETANALAEYTAGDIDSFVKMMNDKISELGLSSSYFENPSGLNGNMVTARELAQIARAAYANPALVEINAALEHTLPALINSPDGINLKNENRLFIPDNPLYYPAAAAGKTGFLRAAGNTLVTYAEQDGRHLISVVLRGNPGELYFSDGKNMLEFGFSQFENHKLSQSEEQVLTEDVLEQLRTQEADTANLSVSKEVLITLPIGAAPDTISRQVTTTLPAGHPEDAVAIIEYHYNDIRVGSAYINNVNRQAAADPLPQSPAIPQTPANAGGNDNNGSEPEQTPTGFRLPSPFITMLSGAGILVIVGISVFIYLRRKEEARKLEERRHNRRLRLKELGISQEEFDQMMTSRKQNRKR